MTTRRATLARMRGVARAAVAGFGLPSGRLDFVDHGENTTYRLTSDAGRFLVRVHRPQRHGRGVDTATAVRSEVAWLDAIRSTTDLLVPEAIRTAEGAATVLASAHGTSRTCSVLRWMDGRIHEASPRAVHLRRLGATMAALHRQADGWTPPDGFVRIDWDHAAFFGDVMVYGETPAADCWDLLPPELRERFRAVGDRLAPLLADDPDIGLVHADLHLGNAVFAGDRVQLIDFDDCGTAPRLYDVAVALWERRDEDDYDELADALLSGYRSLRAIDTTHLDDFIALRQVAFDLWYTGTAQVNPAFAANLDRVHRWSLAMLDLVEGG